MVLASIWFFFIARNGGFHFKKGDWDEYKSTVMRRKGPDGKTLSNATTSTQLGGGSVVHNQSHGTDTATNTTSSSGYTDKEEMREVTAGMGIRGGGTRPHSNRYDTKRRDPELREYRHEKAARVGGLNRAHDGSHFDYTATEPSEAQAPLNAKDKKAAKKEQERREKERKQREREEAKARAAEAKREKDASKRDAKKDKAAAKAKGNDQKNASHGKPTMIASYDDNASQAHPAAVLAAASAAGASPRQKNSHQQRRSHPSAAYSFTAGDDDDAATTVSNPFTNPYSDISSVHSHVSRGSSNNQQHSARSASYYSHYRPHAEPAGDHHRQRTRHTPSPRHSNPPSRQSSPRKQHRAERVQSRDWAQAPASVPPEGNDSDLGTKSYPCYIPGLSSAGSVGVGESVSQVGGPAGYAGRSGRGDGGRAANGYRRGAAGSRRRDSLSDSDG